MFRVFAGGAAAVAIAAVLAWPTWAADAEDDPVVARVDGTEIRRSQALEVRRRLPPQMQQVPDELLLPVLVNIVIDTRIVADEARRQGLQDDPDVRAQMAKLEDLILEQVLIQRTIESGLTDAAVADRYRTLVDEGKGEEEVRARHILVETEEKAKALIVELRTGADFGELADRESTDRSGSKGGDLGYFAKGEMVPAFADAAFAMAVGAYSEQPVETQFGWHVIKVEDRRDRQPPPLDEVSDQLRSEMAREARTAYLERLRDNATIERFDEPVPAPAQPAR